MKFLHELPDAKQLFLVLSQEKKIDPSLVEKDYWIMHAMWGLQNQGFDFELKGGTSLSKGYSIIDRFSEDIDIEIKPEKNTIVRSGKNHTKPQDVESRRSFFEGLAKQIAVPGMQTKRNEAFDDVAQMRNVGIDLIYESSFPGHVKLKPNILLEIGFDQTTPNEQVTISSWAYQRAIESGVKIQDNTAKKVKCYYPEYTFVEKLQAISTKVTKHKESGEFGANFLRHFYDIHMLYQQQRVRNFIGSDAYEAHKSKRFRKNDEMSLKNNLAFNLDKDMAIFNIYEKEFLKLSPLFMSKPPTFKEVYESIIAIREIG